MTTLHLLIYRKFSS